MPLSSGLSGGSGEGPPGPVGPTGSQGVPGPTGTTGSQGQTGVTGSQGPQGIQGTAGATGPQGATGATGPQGATGAQGPAGQNATTTADATQTTSGLESPADKTKLDTLFLPQAYDAYSSGTAPNLTATSSAIIFGTTSPQITIAVAGTYRINARAVINYNGLTVATSRTVTLKIRRTNNTAADIPNSNTDIITGITTLLTAPLAEIITPDVVYAASAGDVLTIFGGYSGTTIAIGTLPVTQASIHAQRVA